MYYRHLRNLREEHVLTRNQLVAILCLNKTNYTKYEQGKRGMPFTLVIRLAIACKKGAPASDAPCNVLLKCG